MSSPNFIWRSLLATQDLFKWETVCRVGGGDSISILTDPWLPDEDNAYVVTENAALVNKSISSLMITGERQWDVDLIHDMFEVRDSNLILSISC